MTGTIDVINLAANDSVMHDTQQRNATVELVCGKPSQRLAQEIAGFWLLHGAMANPVELRRRISEVLLVLRDPESTLIAVTTSYPYPMQTQGRHIGLRAFVDPAWRSLPLRSLMFDAMVTALRKQATEPTALMFCTDNRKLMGKGNRRWFERRGWRRISPDGAEKDEWLMMAGPHNA